MSEVRVIIDRVGLSGFAASTPSGQTARLAGSESLDTQLTERLGDAVIPSCDWPTYGAPFRPMQMVLASLGGCSAIDVLLVAARRRAPISDLRVTLRGVRADATPAVYESIQVHFEATGPVTPKHLERAVDLSMEKYCSVTAMLKDVDIRVTCERVEAIAR